MNDAARCRKVASSALSRADSKEPPGIRPDTASTLGVQECSLIGAPPIALLHKVCTLTAAGSVRRYRTDSNG
jgi:hypothetical protein